MRRTKDRRALPVRVATVFQAGLLVAGTLIPHFSMRGALPAQAKSAGTANDGASHRFPSAGDLFTKQCARCHNEDGTGVGARKTLPTIPDFTSVCWQQKRSTAQLVASVLEGKGTHMPSFAGKITSEDARQLAAHIRAFNPARPSESEAQASCDFQTRFRELQEEFERLRKQFQDLRGTPYGEWPKETYRGERRASRRKPDVNANTHVGLTPSRLPSTLYRRGRGTK
jgi:cytochrome c553